ncbi:cyanate hydratase, partial [Dichotomocladium elegans]
SFEQIGKTIGRDEVYVASIFYGQAKPTRGEIEKLAEVLNLPASHLKDELGAHYFPDRGGLISVPPTDPLLYRFYEILQVYGYPLKAVIHEKACFGDGIMSAIDFNATVEKVENPKGDRVKITLDGKFLPYSKW